MNVPEPITPATFQDPAERDERELQLLELSAEERVEWALRNLPGNPVLTSSFGIHSALMLHLVTRIAPGLPVIFIDTGYLFTETYQLVDELTDRLNLNLHVVHSEFSSAWQESRYGRLWEQGLTGLEQYNQINKVEPLNRAMQELDVGYWFSGLRRQQSDSRARLPVLHKKEARFKMYPVIDWNSREVHAYLGRNQLPLHPLWEKGYVSVGDTHTTRPLEVGMQEQDTRFSGMKRECGIHD
jgi:phosphoadenosine phosphosulfate reductase